MLKKFEPHYRLVRYGAASKIEKASRQQRTYPLYMQNPRHVGNLCRDGKNLTNASCVNRQATQEPSQDGTGYGEREGGDEGQEEVDGWNSVVTYAFGQRNQGGGYLCVSMSCCHIRWRIRYTFRSSTSGPNLPL